MNNPVKAIRKVMPAPVMSTGMVISSNPTTATVRTVHGVKVMPTNGLQLKAGDEVRVQDDVIKGKSVPFASRPVYRV